MLRWLLDTELKTKVLLIFSLIAIAAFFLIKRPAQKVEALSLNDVKKIQESWCTKSDKDNCKGERRFWDKHSKMCFMRPNDRDFIEELGLKVDVKISNEQLRLTREEYKTFFKDQCDEQNLTELLKRHKRMCEVDPKKSWSCRFKKCLSHFEVYPIFEMYKKYPEIAEKALKEKSQVMLNSWCKTFYGNTRCLVEKSRKDLEKKRCQDTKKKYVPKFKKCFSYKSHKMVMKKFISCYLMKTKQLQSKCVKKLLKEIPRT